MFGLQVAQSLFAIWLFFSFSFSGCSLSDMTHLNQRLRVAGALNCKLLNVPIVMAKIDEDRWVFRWRLHLFGRWEKRLDTILSAKSAPFRGLLAAASAMPLSGVLAST